MTYRVLGPRMAKPRGPNDYTQECPTHAGLRVCVTCWRRCWCPRCEPAREQCASCVAEQRRANVRPFRRGAAYDAWRGLDGNKTKHDKRKPYHRNRWQPSTTISEQRREAHHNASIDRALSTAAQRRHTARRQRRSTVR